MNSYWLRLLCCVGLLLLGCNKPLPLGATSADLKPIHGGVQVLGTLNGANVRGLTRLRVGDTVVTDATGRTRVRLDDGTSFLLDHDSKLELLASSTRLHAGRAFVTSPAGVRSSVEIGSAVAFINGSSAALERRTETSVFVAAGELTLRAGNGQEHKLSSGELGSVEQTEVRVAPGRAFQDWTEGLLAPWAAEATPRRALGEVWGRGEQDVGSPLTIRTHDVNVRILGEVAITRVRTSYFNGGSNAVAGDFRFALPTEALVSSFRFGEGENMTQTSIALAARDRTLWVADSPRLEWAGEGWVRGRIPFIAPGAVTTIETEYVEWLSPQPGAAGQVLVQYRYPMVAESEAPLIGEFTVSVDAAAAKPLSMAAGMGASVVGQKVELRRSDFVPSADLVVELALPAWPKAGRLYVAEAAKGDDAGDYVVMRTAAPTVEESVGTPIILLFDTSRSVAASGVDASRALVRAVLAALSEKDRVLVLSADQTVRAVGGEQLEALSNERRERILKSLDATTEGGATDLGAALEAAVAAIPNTAPETLVVYIGDGWATLGDEDLAAIRARLARRSGFTPRIGAVAVGSTPNRVLLSALTRGSGPMFEVQDSADAARAATDLVGLSLRDVVSSLEVDLGPGVERVYPRRPVTVAAGDPITVVGRARGELPKSATLRFVSQGQPRSAAVELGVLSGADSGDLRRRWAEARAFDLVLGQKGREVVTDVALTAGLITPWTALTPDGASYTPTDISALLLDFEYPPSGGLIPTLDLARFDVAALKRPGPNFEDTLASDELPTALAAAIRRKLRDAREAVRSCRDTRAALLPNAPNSFHIQLTVSGKGVVSGVKVESEQRADQALQRCIQLVIEGLAYPNLGLDTKVDVSELLTLPPYTLSQNRRCSAESKLPLGARRGIWQEELQRGVSPLETYMNAKRDCELRSWREKRTLLQLVLSNARDPEPRLGFVAELTREGQVDAAAFVRRETLNGARSAEELARIEADLVGEELLPVAAFKKAYGEAKDDVERLVVVRRFLLLAPHDDRLRGLLIALLVKTGQPALLLEEARLLREDPYADVALLADTASALVQAKFEAEARRSFGELVERAPGDAWVRAFLGDRLRNEGYFDDAAVAYGVLEQLAPGEPRVTVRQALAHAGAGRLDLARRMLFSVAETGGREADEGFARLARQLLNVLTERALSGLLAPELKSALEAAAQSSPHPARGALVLVEAPAAASEITLSLEDPDGHREAPFVVRATELGLYSLERSSNLTQGTLLTLKGPARLEPLLRPLSVRVQTLQWQSATERPRYQTSELVLPADGSAVKLTFDGESFKLIRP